MANLVFIGTGYVGLVSGACMAEIGHNVICVDNNAQKIQTLKNGEIPIFEPSLQELVAENVATGRLNFATDLDLQNADAVFLAVGTPTDPKTDNANLEFLFAAAKEVAEKITDKIFVITKSTVPVGTGAKLAEIFGDKADIISNPEFLREGCAIEDFMQPDRVVCGVETEAAQEFMQKLYKPLNAPIMFSNVTTAELTKYAANAMLASKVVFINEMADLCEATGADITQLAKAVGMDHRIGEKFMNAGPGVGGSCFPKDARALAFQAKQHNVPTKIIEGLIEANDQRKTAMAKKIIDKVGQGANIAIFGLTFKANTDDMRESPAIVIIEELLKSNTNITAYDPEGIEEAKKILPDINYSNSAAEAAKGADAVVIITEWDEFKTLDYSKLELNRKLIIDLRNILNPSDLEGFEYIGVGR